jgi:hypothetical protein
VKQIDSLLTFFQCTSTGFIPDYGEAIEVRNTNRINFEKEGHMKQARYRFFLLPLFFVLACVGLYAQVGSEVAGLVTDQTGAVIGGAKVVLTNPATGTAFTTTSGDTGLYNISGLIPGDYNLKVTAKGFQAYAQTGIVVNVSGTFRVDAKLTIGAETQTITVVADALAVQADSNVLSTLITSEDIGALATENRNMVVLATLGLGVSNNLPDNNNVDSVSASFAISFNGLNNAHNIYLINGAEAYDRGSGGKMAIMPSMDAISEFQVLSSNYPPDYGISSGGTISMSLKSGTNKYHGTLYEENRTTAYDAKKPDSGTAPETHYNIYGGNISGPLFIPNLYNTHRQKTFFFWNEEWRKVIAAGSVTNKKTLDALDFPTAANTASGHLHYVSPAFESSPIVLVQPVGLTAAQLTACGADCAGVGLPFVGGNLPTGMFDPNGVSYLNSGIIPAPGGIGADPGYNIGLASAPLKVRDDVVRIDHNFNDKWRLLGDYVHDAVAANTNGAFMGWTGDNPYATVQSQFTNPAYMATIRLTGTISPNLLLETSINYDGNKINIIDVGADSSINVNKPATWSVQPVLPSFGLWPSSTVCGGAPCRQVMPAMSYGSVYGTSVNTGTDPYHNASEDYEPKVDVSYNAGNHAFKFGFDYNRYVKNQIMGGDSQGQYTQGIETNDGLMDLLLGISDSYFQQQATPILHYYANTPSAYAMDNWHVTPRLTLQLGLRYDAYPHAVERNNQLSNFVPEDYVPDPNMAFTPNNPASNWSATSGPTTNTYGYIGTAQVVNPPCVFHLGYPCVNQGNGTYGSSWAAGGGSISPSAPGVSSDPTISGGLSFYQNGVELAGRNGVPAGLVRNDYKTLQPRIGFSEDLFGNGKTVVRGGFGTFFERIQLNDIMNGSGDAPFAASLNLNDSYFSAPGNNWSDGSTVAGLPVFRTGYTTLTKTYRAPGVAMYSLGVQHELTPSVIWTVQYVGNTGWHQDGDRQINNFALTTPMAYRQDAGDKNNTAPGDYALASTPYWCGANTTLCGPTAGFPSHQNAFAQSRNLGNIGNTLVNFPGYSGINQQENDLSVNYNSLQTGVRIQNRWGLSAEVDYTWSHEIDIVNVDETNMGNPWSTKYDRGSGTLDRRQMISANYVYKLPIFNKDRGLIHSIAGGWELAGTFVDVKGLPAVLSWGGSYDTIGMNGGYANRPNVTGKMTYPKQQAEWFDISKVSAPIPVWLGGPNMGFGSARKDAVVGPGRVNLTTSLYKSFDLSHGVNFMIKGESFNTFNHSEWNSVSTSYNPDALGNFGALNGAYDPRNLQIGGRLTF